MVLFAEKSQKMVLLVKKTVFLIVYRSKGEKESVFFLTFANERFEFNFLQNIACIKI